MKRKDIKIGQTYRHVNHEGTVYLGVQLPSGKTRMMLLTIPDDEVYQGTFVINKAFAGDKRVKEFYAGFRVLET